MEYLPLIGSVALLNFLAVMSPGPDFVIVVRNSLRNSRMSGIYTSMGIGAGLIIHIIYCAVGIGYLISKSTVLFFIIKSLGAGYLIYIGVMSLLSKESKVDLEEDGSSPKYSNYQSFKTGFLTNVLNPKVTLFFLSMFTIVINPTTPWYVISIIAIIVVLTAIIWFSIVSVLFTHKRVQHKFKKFEKPINWFLGILLIGLGIMVAFTLF